MLECEYKKNCDSYQALLNRIDRKTTGRILCLHPEFRAAVRDIQQLFREMHCVKFVGQNADCASSRRRRRMTHHAAMEENLKNAVESLSMSSTDTSERNSFLDQDMSQKQLKRHRSLNSVASGTSDTESWMKCFWEKEMGRFSRPRPISRRAITSDEAHEHYKAVSLMMIPAEEMLVIALNRFPLPDSVVGGDNNLRQNSSLEQSCFSLDSLEKASPRDSEVGPPPHLTAGTLSPRCVARTVFQEDMFNPNSRMELP